MNGIALGLGQDPEQSANVIRSGDDLLNNDVQEVEKGRQEVIVGFEIDLAWMDRLIPNYPEHVHGLLNLWVEAALDKRPDLTVDVAASGLQVIHKHLKSESQQARRTFPRDRGHRARLLVYVAHIVGHVWSLWFTLLIERVDHRVTTPQAVSVAC